MLLVLNSLNSLTDVGGSAIQSVRPVGPTGLTDQSDVAWVGRPVGPTIGTCKRPERFGGTAGAYHSGKTDIVKIARVKNKALLTWQLADIHNVSQNTPPEI